MCESNRGVLYPFVCSIGTTSAAMCHAGIAVLKECKILEK